MTSSASHDAYNTLISLRDKLTQLNGVIMPEAVDKLEDELGGIFTVTKTRHYEQGQKYGHLASAIPESKYRLVIGNTTWNHTVPTNPGAYSSNALAAGNAAATQEQFVVQRKIEQELQGLPERRRGGKGTHPVRLRRRCGGATQEAVHRIRRHNCPPNDRLLCLKTAIRMTTAQKFEYKTNGYNTLRDPTTSITAYFTQLDHLQVSLGDRGIATSDQEKTMAAGAQMWQSKMFTEDQMIAWENRTSATQTRAELQTYFTEKWLEQKQYSATTAKQSRFKEAALQAQEAAAAEEEGKTQKMLFAMLQDQHTKQIAQMEAMNKANMESMMEKMNALVASNATRQLHQPDKENIPPGGNVKPPGGGGGDKQARKPKKKKALCPNCKCYELEANKAKRYPPLFLLFLST
jgi:hypothetical protein